MEKRQHSGQWNTTKLTVKYQKDIEMDREVFTYTTTITLNVVVSVEAEDEGEAQEIIEHMTLQDIIDSDSFTDHWEDWTEDTDDSDD